MIGNLGRLHRLEATGNKTIANFYSRLLQSVGQPRDEFDFRRSTRVIPSSISLKIGRNPAIGVAAWRPQFPVVSGFGRRVAPTSRN